MLKTGLQAVIQSLDQDLGILDGNAREELLGEQPRVARACAAEIGGDLSTVNGDIDLEDRSVVKGDLIVEAPSGWYSDKEKRRKPRVVIGPGSRVEGTIVLERKVELYISETAEVGGVSGEMTMDDAVRFSGERP